MKATVAALALGGTVLLNCPTRQEIARPVMSQSSLPHADFIVSRDSGARFASIQAAVDSAGDGDSILVMPGEYPGGVKIARARRLSLFGADPAVTVIDATGLYAGIEVKTDSNRVSGFTIRDADSHGIWVRDGRQFIDHCVVTGNGDRGIYLSAMAGYAFAIIDHCTIADNGESGIYAARDDPMTAVTNTIVAFNMRGIVTDQSEGLLQIRGNFVFNAGTDFDRVTPGPLNIKGDPQFVDRENRDYRLRRKSPCVGAGTGGTNVGAF